MECVGLEIRDR